MRKLLVLFAAALLVAMFAAVSQAAPPAQTGEVPDAVLADLGLAGMERVSDAQGEAVRGKWFFSKLPNSFSTGIYIALNALPLPKNNAATTDVGGGTGDSGPNQRNNWDVSWGAIPANSENQAAAGWRNMVNQVNQVFANQLPNGINGFGPGAPAGVGAPAPIGGANPVGPFQLFSLGGVGGPFFR